MIVDLPRVATPTVEATVYDALRDRIVRGLAPGLPLRPSDLARQLGVSTMPVRAALIRLEHDGLVRHDIRRGVVVAPLELEDLEEIQAIRAGIEGFAARLGAERIDLRGLARMEHLLRRLEHLAEAGSFEAYLTAHWELHETCYRAADRPRLLGLTEDYRRRAERYIRLAVGTGSGIRGSIVHQERLVRACRVRSGPAAEDVMRDALAWTVAQLRDRLAPPEPDRDEGDPGVDA